MQSGVEREARPGFAFQGSVTGGHEMAASESAEKIFDRVKAQLKVRLGGADGTHDALQPLCLW